MWQTHSQTDAQTDIAVLEKATRLKNQKNLMVGIMRTFVTDRQTSIIQAIADRLMELVTKSNDAISSKWIWREKSLETAPKWGQFGPIFWGCNYHQFLLDSIAVYHNILWNQRNRMISSRENARKPRIWAILGLFRAQTFFFKNRASLTFLEILKANLMQNKWNVNMDPRSHNEQNITTKTTTFKNISRRIREMTYK